jgi:hypothetical protein
MTGGVSSKKTNSPTQKRQKRTPRNLQTAQIVNARKEYSSVVLPIGTHAGVDSSIPDAVAQVDVDHRLLATVEWSVLQNSLTKSNFVRSWATNLRVNACDQECGREGNKQQRCPPVSEHGNGANHCTQ